MTVSRILQAESFTTRSSAKNYRTKETQNDTNQYSEKKTENAVLAARDLLVVTGLTVHP